MVTGTLLASAAQASPYTLANLNAGATAGSSYPSPGASSGDSTRDWESATPDSNLSSWSPAPSALSLSRTPLPHSHIAPALGVVWRSPAAVEAVGFIVTAPSPASLEDRIIPAVNAAGVTRTVPPLQAGISPKFPGLTPVAVGAEPIQHWNALIQLRASEPDLSGTRVLAASYRVQTVSPAGTTPIPATAEPSKSQNSPVVPTPVEVPLRVVSFETSTGPAVHGPASSPAVATPSQSDLVQLAKLDQDLADQETRLNQTAGQLTQSQQQLQNFTDVLHAAVLAAGPDARGLHPFVKVAENYIGTPYVWGGVSARGFDCSGFVIRVMRDLGYHALPHSAAEQFHYGIPVDEKDLKPGDLVFFANTYKPGVSHVGIYLGNRKFINAANTAVGTIVSSLDEPKWRAKYAGARRLLPMKA